MIAVLCACQHNGLTRDLAWIIEGANLFQFSTDNKTQIDNMIHAVNRLHVENSRDIIAVDNVLPYFYTPDKRQNAREEGISGPSSVMPGANGMDDRSLRARPFK
jgi:hypothetical protein